MMTANGGFRCPICLLCGATGTQTPAIRVAEEQQMESGTARDWHHVTPRQDDDATSVIRRMKRSRLSDLSGLHRPCEHALELAMAQAPSHSTFAALISSFTSFLTVAIHTILYERSIYPVTTFLSARKYDMPVRQNRHPSVCRWISDAAAAVETEMLKVRSRPRWQGHDCV